MTHAEEFPSRITAAWISRQKFPYNSLVDCIIHLLSDEGYDEFELPSGLFRLWLVRRFETDVVNGGFGQFLGNAMDSRDGSDRFLRATLPAVQSFGLAELEPLVAETIRIHGGIVEFERRRRPVEGRGTGKIRMKAFRESTDAQFDELKDRWAKIDYDAWQLKLEEYIRDHLEEFVFDTQTRRPKMRAVIRTTRDGQDMRSKCVTGPEDMPGKPVQAFIARAQAHAAQKRDHAFTDFHRIIDEYLNAAGRSRGRHLGRRQRTRVHEQVPASPDCPRIRWFVLLSEAIQANTNDERDAILGEFVTMALYSPGERYPVPNAIVRELVRRASDDELFDVLDEVVCEWLSRGGAYSGPNWKRRQKLLYAKLPRGLRASHNLMSLESEVLNGGFVQFFGNSSGTYSRETLADCRLVGAEKKAALLRRAMALINEYYAATERIRTSDRDPFALDDPDDDCVTEMDRLADAYYELEETEALYRLVSAYIRAHPQKCTTSRRGRIVSKRRS